MYRLCGEVIAIFLITDLVKVVKFRKRINCFVCIEKYKICSDALIVLGKHTQTELWI